MEFNFQVFIIAKAPSLGSFFEHQISMKSVKVESIFDMQYRHISLMVSVSAETY